MKRTLLTLTIITLIAVGTAQAQSLVNGGFELKTGNLPSNWTASLQSSGVTSSSKMVNSGRSAVQFDDQWTGPGAGVLLRSDEINGIVVGDRYIATVMIYDSTGEGTLYIEFWNAKGERILEYHVASTESGKWEKLSVEGKAPITTVYCTVGIYSASDNTGIFYADDATFAKKGTNLVEKDTTNICLNLFPNPSNGLLYWNCNSKINSVALFDVNGKKVKTFTGNQRELNCSDLQSGTYFVHFRGHSALVRKKLILLD